MQNIRYTYLHDPKNPKRVLTLARTLEGGVLTVAWAMNTPPRKTANMWGDLFREPGDIFTKKRGREIATGRLECSSLEGVVTPGDEFGSPNPPTHFKVQTILKEGESPVRAAMKAVSAANPHVSTLQRIVAYYAELWEQR